MLSLSQFNIFQYEGLQGVIQKLWEDKVLKMLGKKIISADHRLANTQLASMGRFVSPGMSLIVKPQSLPVILRYLKLENILLSTALTKQVAQNKQIAT